MTRARGEPLSSVGDPLPAGELVALELPRARQTEPGVLVAHALTNAHGTGLGT